MTGARNALAVRIQAGLRAAQGVGVVLHTTATLLAMQYEVENQMHAVGASFVVDRMHAAVVDFEECAFPQVNGVAANGKLDIVVRDDRQMNAMLVRQ